MSEEIKDAPLTVENAFDDDVWVEGKPSAQVAEEPKAQVEVPNADAKVDTPIIDYNQFVKEKFGYDSVELAEQDFKKLKEAKPQEFKEVNLSEVFVEKEEEILNYLSNKKKFERLSKDEVTINSAEEIIKLGLQAKYKDLSSKEIDFEFNEQFSYPKKPSQTIDETDEEFQSREEEWKHKVESIQQKIVIEAKKFKPELERLRSELVLPNIQQQLAANNEPNPKDLELAKTIRQNYENALESDYKNFNGFNVTVKNEDVDVQVSFTPSDEDKVTLKKELSDFSADEYFGSRWFTEDGKPKVTEMMADKYFLEKKEQILQKIANEAVAQFKEKFIKARGNVTLNQQPQGTFNPDNVTEKQKVEDALWEA